MINPQQSAKNILRDNPALAKDLLDLMLWADQPNLGENNDYDDIKNLCFVKLQRCRDARDAYAKGRTEVAPTEIVLASERTS